MNYYPTKKKKKKCYYNNLISALELSFKPVLKKNNILKVSDSVSFISKALNNMLPSILKIG